ncbi:MAG: hypothetical protein II401_05080 [Bacteroidales bacterium]|nr:hypothetical protein [Bacteroidales bacterium]
MKKAYKVTWISLASLVGVVLIVLLIALYLLLSPKRLTGLVNRYAKDFITCEYNIGKVDLTLFKTFPDAGIEINDVVLINPTNGWTTDTLAAIDKLVVSVNLRKILFENEIIVNSCLLDGGLVNVFFDTEGNSNLDIFPPSEAEPNEAEEGGSFPIDLNKLALNNIEVRYTDLGANTVANINGLGLKAKGMMKDELIDGDINLSINDLRATIDNDTANIDAAIKDINFKGKVKMVDDDINANISLGTGALALLMTGNENIMAGLNSLNVSYNGDVNDYDYIKGTVNLDIDDVTAIKDNDTYADKADFSLEIPLELNLTEYQAKFEKSEINLNKIKIEFIGSTTLKDDITMNMDIRTNTMIINDLIRLLPEKLKEELLGGMKIDGKLMLLSHIEGVYNDSLMPVINADVTLNDGFFQMDGALPHPLTAVNTTIHTDLDLNGKSDVYIKSLRARMNNTIVAASGSIKDVLDKMLCNLSVKADVHFDDIKTFMPEEMLAKGMVKADVNLKGTVDQFTNVDLMKTKLNGTLRFKDLDFTYYDTINVNSSDLGIDFIIPNPSVNSLHNGLAHVQLYGDDLKAVITDMMDATLSDFNIEAQVTDVLDENAKLGAIADFGIGYLDFMIDDMLLYSENATGSAMMLPSVNEGNTSYAAVYSSDSLVFGMADELYFATEVLSLDINADYDERESELLFQWKPDLGLYLGNAILSMADVSEEVIVPEISLTYGEPGLVINNSQITLGNSDFKLSGYLTNLYEHFKNDELLVGEFDFTSDYTDVNQLMDIFSGAGSEEETANTEVSDTTAVEEANPFMVPLGVDIKMHTTIRNAIAGDMQIRNVGGDLTIKDGILVLEEMGFTSDAAIMQLTALYKSKRKNHLYAGFDFHLLDIDIAEMIKIIPDLDTIVPMLSSFAGNAEFHFAAETNLKADYTPKYSTLKGACSIEGTDLVVLDSETFDKIKKMLMFSKNTDNKIDSLDVQFTVFKNEIDVYPFAISMDKYSAMLYGRHNLDMSYDYKIEMLSPAILNRLGLEIKGPDFDNMKFKVRRSRHRNIFKPEKRDYKEEKIVELKKIISNSLKENVKPQ